MEAPKYRTRVPCHVNCVMWDAGAVVGLQGWPKGDLANKLEPVNEAAKRIVAWFHRNAGDAFMPQSPWDSEHGRYYLPATSKDTRGGRVHPVKNPLSSMPHYRARIASDGIWLPDEFAFLGWPQLGMALTPANEPAERVVAYFEMNAGNPAMLASPWNQYDDELFLPMLKAGPVKGRTTETGQRPFPRAGRHAKDAPEGLNAVQRALWANV